MCLFMQIIIQTRLISLAPGNITRCMVLPEGTATMCLCIQVGEGNPKEGVWAFQKEQSSFPTSSVLDKLHGPGKLSGSYYLHYYKYFNIFMRNN